MVTDRTQAGDGGGAPEGDGGRGMRADRVTGSATERPGDGGQPPLVTVTVLLLSSLTVMANATISPALPGLARAFPDTEGIETLAGLALSLPSLSVVVTAIGFGVLLDRVDRRRLIAGLALLYALAGASGVLAPGIWSLLAGRVVLGIAVAGLMSAVTMLAGELWRDGARDRFMGRQAAATGVGGVVFILTGGALAALDWRGPFLVYLAALPLAPLAYVVLAAPLRRRRDVEAARKPAGDDLPWSFVLSVCSVAFCVMVAFYLIPTRLPFRLEALGVTSPLVVGGTVAAVTAASVPVSLAYGRLHARFSFAAIFAGAIALIGLGLGTIAIAQGAVLSGVGCLCVGFGLGAVIPNQAAWLMSNVPGGARGRASGLLTMAIFSGQFASPLVAAPLEGLGGTQAPFAVAGIAMAVLAGLMTYRQLRGGLRAPDAELRKHGDGAPPNDQGQLEDERRRE